MILCMGHGSRDLEGANEYMDLVRAVQAALPAHPVEAGFLEFAGPVVPSIQEAVDRCVSAGAEKVLAVPVLLMEAGHARTDMPAEVARARQRHPHLDLRCAPHLGIHPLMVEMLEERIHQLQQGLGAAHLDDTAVLLVGRGTSDIEANGDFYKIGRLVWERNRYPMVECCFISLAEPSLFQGIQRCVQLGARRILVMPYFINTGILVKRICSESEEARQRYPEVEIAVGEHFGAHPKIIQLLVSRVMFMVDGAAPEPAVSWGRTWRTPALTHHQSSTDGTGHGHSHGHHHHG
jgi:sirohydrochlorin cobaltochelatase